MDDYTADEVSEARAPIASLLSKSEKAQQKLAPGSWQHTMLEGNIRALRIASPLIGEEVPAAADPAREELDSAVHALDSMIERVANTQTKFAPGTSQHSLQRNRLKALRIARWAVLARIGEDQRESREQLD
ncbi:MAG: hypothetical protein VB139_00420 [Coriobacteriia bacterium]|nr:hypothetical protein [Coriobacteriia bacterium]